jgi:hypothetical protein
VREALALAQAAAAAAADEAEKVSFVSRCAKLCLVLMTCLVRCVQTPDKAVEDLVEAERNAERVAQVSNRMTTIESCPTRT